MQLRNNLSAVIITRGNEGYLESVLESIAWIKDIVLVIDTDKTGSESEILGEKFKTRVFRRVFTTYSEQKNFGVQQAEEEWVLNIDADEVVTKELAEELKSLVFEGNVNSYWIPFKNFLGAKWLKYGGMYPDHHLRLFRKNVGVFEGKIHEKLKINGSFKYLINPIKHLTYKNKEDYLNKVRKYSVLEAISDFEQGNRVNLLYYLKIPLRFFKIYFLKFGFLDGFNGLINALFLTYYLWLKISKMRQLENENRTNNSFI